MELRLKLKKKKKLEKTSKYLEIKQHTFKQSIGQRRSGKENRSIAN